MFIVVDGPNGSGKTTLIKNLRQLGVKTLSSPSATELSSMLRPACRGTDKWSNLDKYVKFFLFSAARMDEYIKLVHNKKEIIVADRWWTSTFVYQCMYENIPVETLEATIHPDEKIDMVVLLDCDDDILIDRINKDRASDPKHGRCTWTQTSESIIKLANIYRNEIKAFLASRGIKYCVLNTSSFNEEEVVERFNDIIKSLN